MKKSVFKFVYFSFFITSFMACGVKGRPEPPLRQQQPPDTQTLEQKPPVTLSTDKPAVKSKSSSKKKNGN